MFRLMMKKYNHDSYLSSLKGTIWIALFVVVGALSINGFSPYASTSEPTPHDGFMFMTVITGCISVFISVHVIDYLVNFFGASWHYLRHLRENGFGKISFNLETLYDITLNNRYFYAFVVSLGYMAGIAERYLYVHRLSDTAAWETVPAYYFTYLKYPVLVFFIGILSVTITYGVLVVLQKPLNYFLKKSGVPTRIHGLFHQLIFHAKNKSVLMVFFGVVPSVLFVAYMSGLLPTQISLTHLGQWYLIAITMVYPVVVFVMMGKEKKQTKRSKTKPNNKPKKAKQTTYDKIASISISSEMEKEITDVIREINVIVEEINPYLNLAEIEEAHALKRMTENEILNLMDHYHKLPRADQKTLKNELLERLHSAKQTAAKIAATSRNYHLEGFKKQSDLMEQRYNTEKNA